MHARTPADSNQTLFGDDLLVNVLQLEGGRRVHAVQPQPRGVEAEERGAVADREVGDA